jgi:hypothetical protein
MPNGLAMPAVLLLCNRRLRSDGGGSGWWCRGALTMAFTTPSQACGAGEHPVIKSSGILDNIDLSSAWNLATNACRAHVRRVEAPGQTRTTALIQ